MNTRLSKVVLVFSVALFSSLAVINNVTDYDSNFMFVKHVLSMDDTFPGNNGMWRSVTTGWMHHVGYTAIILTEAAEIEGTLRKVPQVIKVKNDVEAANLVSEGMAVYSTEESFQEIFGRPVKQVMRVPFVRPDKHKRSNNSNGRG